MSEEVILFIEKIEHNLYYDTSKYIQLYSCSQKDERKYYFDVFHNRFLLVNIFRLLYYRVHERQDNRVVRGGSSMARSIQRMIENIKEKYALDFVAVTNVYMQPYETNLRWEYAVGNIGERFKRIVLPSGT